MSLGNHSPHQVRIGLGPKAGHAKGGFDPLVVEKIEDFGARSRCQRRHQGQRDLEATVGASIDDRAEPRAGIGRRWRPQDACGWSGRIILRVFAGEFGLRDRSRPCRNFLENAAVSDDERTSGAAGFERLGGRVRDLGCRITAAGSVRHWRVRYGAAACRTPGSRAASTAGPRACGGRIGQRVRRLKGAPAAQPPRRSVAQRRTRVMLAVLPSGWLTRSRARRGRPRTSCPATRPGSRRADVDVAQVRQIAHGVGHLLDDDRSQGQPSEVRVMVTRTSPPSETSTS